MANEKFITIKNAGVHNIRNIDIQPPKKKLAAIAGVSGSGKSSIVYDILYKTSVNQYLRYRDLVSDTLEIQTCDEIIGLSPVIAVRQNTMRQANPKSVIGAQIQDHGRFKKAVPAGRNHSLPSLRRTGRQSEVMSGLRGYSADGQRQTALV